MQGERRAKRKAVQSERKGNKKRKFLICLFRSAAGFMQKPQDFLFLCRAAACFKKQQPDGLELLPDSNTSASRFCRIADRGYNKKMGQSPRRQKSHRSYMAFQNLFCLFGKVGLFIHVFPNVVAVFFLVSQPVGGGIVFVEPETAVFEFQTPFEQMAFREQSNLGSLRGIIVFFHGVVDYLMSTFLPEPVT